jgi:hypothetical protein
MPFRELGKNGLTVMLISHRLEVGMVLEGLHLVCGCSSLAGLSSWEWDAVGRIQARIFTLP